MGCGSCCKCGELEREQLDSTTLHGVKKLVGNDSLGLKILWSIAITVCVVALLASVVKLLIEFFNPEISTLVSIERARELLLPSITLCSFNLFNKSAIEEFGLSTNASSPLLKYLRAGISPASFIMDPQFMENILNESYTTDMKLLYKNQTGLEWNYTEFVKKATALDISSFVELCLAIDPGTETVINCLDSGYVVEHFTSTGQCVTLNHLISTKFLSQRQPGMLYGLNILVNPSFPERLDIPGNLKLNGIMVYVHSKERPASAVEAYGMYVLPGSVAAVPIRIRNYTFIKDCDKSSTSQGICENQCTYDFTNSKCKCRLATTNILGDHIVSDTPICDPEVAVKCVYFNADDDKSYNDCLKQCVSRCKKTKYFSSISYAKLSLLNEGLERNDSILLQVYFESMDYEIFEQKQDQSFVKLISDVGGQMGLYIGASLLTLTEIVDYLIKKICGNKKKRSKREAENVGLDNHVYI